MAIDKLWAMEVFVRVAECGSFTRAADALDLANATVSTCVRNLEQDLHVKLINRDTRRVRLTEEGHVYFERARQLLQAVEQAQEEVRARAGELSGWLHVEMQISIGHALICRTLPMFAQRYPEISTAVTLTAEPSHMIERSTDVAIRMNYVEDADLIARPFFESRYVICCTPELEKTLPHHPSELDPRLCIGMLPEERRHANVWTLQKGDETVELPPSGPLHFNSSEALIMAAEAGVGLTCVLDFFAIERFESGTLVQVYADWTLPTRTFYLVSPKARGTSAKVRAFTDFLFEVLNTKRHPNSSAAVAVKALGKRQGTSYARF